MKETLTIYKQIERNGLILIALAAVAVYWVLDSLVTEQTFTRTMIAGFVIVYGVFTQILISSRKDALAEKERTQQQLIQTESLAAIGQLVAGIAHELNNPLSSASSLIQNDIELINEQQNKSEVEDEILNDLQFSLKEIHRAETIVKSVLGLSRQSQTYVEDVNINAVLEDALRVLYNQYKYKEVNIVRDYEEDLPVVNGNFANLGQVFLNVIKNAFQALPDGKGTITLKTRYDTENNRVITQCSDTGAGIAPDIINDIFRPFFTTKEVGAGTGLGLYISHEIIKKHEGLISVKSKQGKGTTFTIDLPGKI